MINFVIYQARSFMNNLKLIIWRKLNRKPIRKYLETHPFKILTPLIIIVIVMLLHISNLLVMEERCFLNKIPQCIRIIFTWDRIKNNSPFPIILLILPQVFRIWIWKNKDNKSSKKLMKNIKIHLEIHKIKKKLITLLLIF